MFRKRTQWAPLTGFRMGRELGTCYFYILLSTSGSFFLTYVFNNVVIFTKKLSQKSGKWKMPRANKGESRDMGPE